MLDFTSVRNKEKTLDDLATGLTATDLHALTDEMIDTVLGLIADATDAEVVFEPEDPEAFDEFTDVPDEVQMAWTLGHVIVHITASSEEAAAQATTLARHVEVTGRSRYETPWRTVSTVAQLRQRLEESRRMCHAFLNAWPDEPHLDMTYQPKYPGARARNAITYFVGGLAHADAHLGQIEDIMYQARAARGAP